MAELFDQYREELFRQFCDDTTNGDPISLQGRAHTATNLEQWLNLKLQNIITMGGADG